MQLFYAGQTDFIAMLNLLASGLYVRSVENNNHAAVVSTWHIETVTDKIATLPAFPSINDSIRFSSASDTVTKLTLARNGNNINGVAADVILQGASVNLNVEIIYVSASIGWRIIMQPAALTPVVGVGGPGPGIERAIRRGKMYIAGF